MESATEKKSELPGEGILKKSIRSGKWLTLGYILQKFIGFFSFLILARLLTPADFGIIAIVLLVPKFLQNATETGLSAAAIQKEGGIQKYLDPIWTIGIIKSAIILVITFWSGPIIADFFHAPNASLAVRLGGIFIFIQNCANIGEIYFFKDIDFKKIFFRDTIREISYTTVAIATVFLFHSYWALMAATLSAYASQMISTYILHPYRPTLTKKWGPIKELIGYSKWIVGRGWANQLYSTIESAAVAKLTGLNATGLYTKAKNMASIMPGFLSSIINNVSFSAYAKIKDSKEKIQDGLIKSFDVLFFVSIPIMFLILAAGGKIILILIGAQWLPMIDAMRLLLIFFVINNVTDIGYTLFEAMGVPSKALKFDAIKIPLTIILMILLTYKYGISGTATALLVGTLPTFILMPIYIKKLTGLKYSSILGTFLPPALLTTAIITPLLFFKNIIITLPNFYFIIITALSGVLYLLAIYIIGKKWGLGPFKTIQTILTNI